MFSLKQWIIAGTFIFYSVGIWHMSSVYTDASNNKAKVAAVEKEIENTKAEKAKAVKFYNAFIAEKQKNSATQRNIEIEVVREVEKPIYNECIIPDSGVLLIERAINHSNSRLSTN